MKTFNICFYAVFLSVILSCGGGKTGDVIAIVSQEDFTWLGGRVREQLAGCRVAADDGTVLFTPDGMGNYKALWTRDFLYMVENAIEFFDREELKRAILFLLSGQRGDGCMPDRVEPSGRPVYSPGPVERPIADHALDNGPFMAKLVYEYVRRFGDKEFFLEAEPKIRKGLEHIARDERGLVWNDPGNPQCPYGFTDTVQKTGALLFSSLLYGEASLKMAELCRELCPEGAGFYEGEVRRIKENLDFLWDDTAGMYLAASADCRQIDIWGSAYAVYTGFAEKGKTKRIAHYLILHYDELVESGHVRHLPGGEYWEKTFVPIPRGEYQNGAFWATPSGWVMYTIGLFEPERARQMASDLIAYFKKYDIFECVNGEYRKLENYVASAANPFGAIKRILSSKPVTNSSGGIHAIL